MKLFKKNQKKILLLVFFVLSFSVFACQAFALEVNPPELFGLNIGSGTLPEYVRYIFGIGIIIAVILALIVFAYGTIYFFLDYARGKILNEGKEWMKAGVIGLLLSAGAYLILYTINPDLVILRLDGLPIPSYLFSPSGGGSGGMTAATYKEIPIGSLTESLLSRTMACYNYDDNGDPIDGEKIKTDDGRQIIGPTYLNHDRVDCAFKLGEAIENKAELVKQLSDKLVALMEQCSCSLNSGGAAINNTENPSNYDLCLNSSISAPSNSSNAYYAQMAANTSNGLCLDPICKVEHCTVAGNHCNDSCKSACKCSSSQCDQCPQGVKDKIDHGPICMTYLCNATQDFINAYNQAHPNPNPNDCSAIEKKFAGMDEFRSQYNNSYEMIKQVVEMQPAPKYEGKEISVMLSGNCNVCNNTCQACDPDSNNYQSCQQQRQDCLENVFNCENNRKQCLMQNSPWYKLRLIDQLTYLKGKLEEIKQKVQIDLNNLTRGETELGQCYLADSSVDFKKRFEGTDEDFTLVKITQGYTDQDTNKYVNPEKYCQGFQYDNSTCYSQCRHICPTDTAAAFDCFGRMNIQSCSDIRDAADKKTCIDNQSKEYIKCVYKQKCTVYGNRASDSYSTFKECFDGCKQKCLDQCELLCDTPEKNACKNLCNNNSKCMMDNAAACLVDVEGLAKCATKYNDNQLLEQCYKSVERCTYCSDQYSGYVDCVENSATIYTASYIYKNPSIQICKSPNEAKRTSQDQTTTCITLYPETQKCPASSKCPECLCGIIDAATRSQLRSASAAPSSSSSSGSSSSSSSSGGSGACQTTNPSAPGYCAGGGRCVGGACTYGSSSSSSGSSGGTTGPITNPNSEYRVCSANCDDAYHKDDPLTFYCKTDWWVKNDPQRTSPEGKERLCLKSREVPVGQTVDESELWGQAFLYNIENISQATQSMISYMDKIGKEQNYCKCDSKCDYGPLCQTKCIYHQATVTDEETGEETIVKWCTRSGCQGQPCQKIINMLKGGTGGNNNCASYPGIQSYVSQITSAVDAFYRFIVTSTRSDLVKKLEYSRSATDTCSTTQNNYGVSVEMLSCTRVEDEIVSPIVDNDNRTKYNNQITPSYCYGKELGTVLGTTSPLMDNWFCCEQREKQAQ